MKKVKLDCYREIWKNTLTREETTEAVVSDVLPDISRIIDCTGVVCLRGKEAREGEVSVTCKVNACVTYLPEDEGRVRRLDISVPITLNADAPGVNDDCEIVVRLGVCSIEARALNPRKVLVRAEVCFELFAYCRGSLNLAESLENAEASRINVKEGAFEFTTPTAVSEKTFVLNDEYAVPPSRPAIGELLSKRIELTSEDVKSVGNKLIFKGTAGVKLLYNPVDEGAPAGCDFSLGFSQIIEMSEPMENSAADLALALTGEYIDPAGTDGRQVNVELHIVAQAVGTEGIRLKYVEDAYCNEHPLTLKRDLLTLERDEAGVLTRESVREQLETEESAAEVLDVYALPGPVSVDGDRLKSDVTVRAVYKTDSGHVRSHTARLPISGGISTDGGTRLKSPALRCLEVFATPQGSGIELRLTAEFFAGVTRDVTVEPVAELTLDEQTTIAASARPSVTVLPSDYGREVWELAKRYGSTPEILLAVNGLEPGETKVDGLLLIPRAR